MKFGLALPQYDFSVVPAVRAPWDEVAEWAVRAEELGFDSVWLSDHLFYDLARYGGPRGPRRCVECFTGLAALAVITRRVRLGALVACNDLRHPGLLAKMAATVDELSGGRAELGIGAGWFEPEYRAAGIPFDPAGVRISRLEEAVRVIRGLLGDGEISFRGRFYELEGALCLPRPRHGLPVTVGGRGPRIVELAGRSADGFNSAWACSPEEFERLAAEVDSAARRAGRQELVTKSVGLYALPGLDEAALERRWRAYCGARPPGMPAPDPYPVWAADKLAGNPQVLRERIDRFEQAGVDEIILTFGTIPFQLPDPAAVEEFMDVFGPGSGRAELGARSRYNR